MVSHLSTLPISCGLLYEDPWRRKWQPTPVFLPQESHEQRSLAATVQGVARVGHDLATKPPHEDQPISIHITLNSLQNSKNPNPRNPKSIWM